MTKTRGPANLSKLDHIGLFESSLLTLDGGATPYVEIRIIAPQRWSVKHRGPVSAAWDPKAKVQRDLFTGWAYPAKKTIQKWSDVWFSSGTRPICVEKSWGPGLKWKTLVPGSLERTEYSGYWAWSTAGVPEAARNTPFGTGRRGVAHGARWRG